MQFILAAMIYGVMLPVVRIAEMTGRTERMFKAMTRRRRDAFIKKDPFANCAPGPQDVIVMTYPKCGTNWMMQIALQLAYHGNAEFEHIHNMVPWPDSVGPMAKYAIPWHEATHWKTAPEKLRIVKTHLEWEQLPYSPEARYIAVIRDPKDVFVSHYHFFKGAMGPAMPSVDSWYNIFLAGDTPPSGCWAQRTAGYWAERHRPNVLIMSFKQMKRDLPASIRTVAAFLNLHPSEDILREVERRSSFAYMKANDDKFSIGQLIPWGPKSSLVRKGNQGGSSELLTPDQQRKIDAVFQDKLKALGCDLPYEEFADLAV